MKRIKKLGRGGGLPRMQLGSTVQLQTSAVPRGAVPASMVRQAPQAPAPSPDELRRERAKQVAQQQRLPYVPVFLTPEDYTNYQQRFKQVAADALDDRDDRRYLKFTDYHPAPEFLPEEERGYDCINGICGLDEASGLYWSNAPDKSIKRYLSNYRFINNVRGVKNKRGQQQPMEDYYELNADRNFNGVFEVGDQFMLLGKNKIPHHSMKLLNIDYDDEGNPTLYRMIENDGNTKFHNETTLTPDELAQRFYERGYDVSPPEWDDEFPAGNNDILVVRPGRYLKEHMSKEEWEAAQEQRIAAAIEEQRRQRAAMAARSSGAPARTAVAGAPAPAPARGTTAAVTGTPVRHAWGGVVDQGTRGQYGGAVGGVSVEGYKHDSPDRFNDFNIIPSNNITMQNVRYPVMGTDDLGYQQLMFPGAHYIFPGSFVMEQQAPLRAMMDKPLPRRHYQKGGAYKGYSIVDFLKSIGEDASMANRKQLAAKMGIDNYSGTSVQNLELLRKLRDGERPGAEPVTMEDGKNYMRSLPFMREQVVPTVRKVLNRLGQEEVQRVEAQQDAMDQAKNYLRTVPFVRDNVIPAVRKVRAGVDYVNKVGAKRALDRAMDEYVTPTLDRWGNAISGWFDGDDEDEAVQGKKPGEQVAVKAKEEVKKEEKKEEKKAPAPAKRVGPNPKDVRLKNGYVNLADYGVKLYNPDGYTYSPEAIDFAMQVQEANPNEDVKFVCNQKGCFAIANRAAEGLGGTRLTGPGAWQTSGKTTWQSPTMKAYAVGSGQPLPTPTEADYRNSDYLSMLQPGDYVKLDRANNRVNGAALTAAEADDSYDYVNPAFFPQSTGNEHIAYVPKKDWLLHGTGAGAGHPGFFVVQNLRKNKDIRLPGVGRYAPVAVVSPGGRRPQMPEEPSFWDDMRNRFGFAYGGAYDGYGVALPGASYVFPGQDVLGVPVYQVGGQPAADYMSRARRVDVFPAGYNEIGKEGYRTYGMKREVEAAPNLPAVVRGRQARRGAEEDAYLAWIKEQGRKGVSLDEMIKKRFIHPGRRAEFEQYFRGPSTKDDYVYMEAMPPSMPSTVPVVPAPVPVAAAGPITGSSNLRMYDKAGHAYGDIFYASRNSKDASDPGTLNTAQQEALLRRLDKMGQYIPGEEYVLPADVLDTMTHGTHTFQDLTDLPKYKKPSYRLGGPRRVNRRFFF